MTYLVHIHDRRLAVADDAIDELQEQVLEAARNGGAFIPVNVGSGARASVLVTAATPVWIEHVPPEREEEEPEGDFPDFAYLDVDI